MALQYSLFRKKPAAVLGCRTEASVATLHVDFDLMHDLEPRMTRTNSRRSFLATLGHALLLAHVAPRLLAKSTSQFSADIAELYRKSVVIDTLCSPFTSDGRVARSSRDRGSANLRHHRHQLHVSAPTFEGTVDNLAYVDALVEQSPEVFTIVRLHSDIARAKREGKIGIMPGFQYTQFLEDDPSRIETFRRLGVRIMQLTLQQPQHLRRRLPGTGQCRAE